MRLVLDARSASFGALIDDASLLSAPPSLIDDAVSSYRDARSSSSGWMTGRFLCPTSQLADLASSLMRSLESGKVPWEVTAVFDGDIGASASAAQAFHTEMQPAATIAAAQVHLTAQDPEDISDALDAIASIQPEIVPFLELDPRSRLEEQIAIVDAELSRRSRVGGVQLGLGSEPTASSPPIDAATTFVMEATTHRLPFTIPTGLDAPIRRCDDDHDAWHHGIVNLLVAAAAAGQGHTFDTVADIIMETDPEAFSMGAAFISWRDVSIPGPAMRRIRANGFIAFGSNELHSTVQALHDFGFLGEGT